MKKLMIAAAIVCAAAMSQAAMIDWKLGKEAFTMSDGGSIGGVNVSLVQFASATALQTAWEDMAAGKTTIADYQVIDTQPGSTASKSIGKIDVSEIESNYLTEGARMAYALYIQDGNKFLLSTDTPGMAYDPNGEIEKEGITAAFSSDNFDMSKTQQLGSWSTASAVPEPTSGLLLLLGVAGLALRRRRA